MRPARLLVMIALLVSNAAWAANVLPVTAAEDGVFKVSVKATHKFTRNTDKLKEQALKAATDFCAKDGKTMKVVSVQEDKNQYLVGEFAQVTLRFKALVPGDAELTPGQTAAPVPPKPMTTDALGAELTKLDALRKQGLLTDAEFDALKQKLLSRF